MKAVITEDDLVVADYLQNILQVVNVKTIAIATDVNEAEQTLDQRPDFFLIDIRLANNQSGISLGEKLHQLEIPFIYITANNELQTLKKAIATQPETYITKPFNKRDIIAAVELLRIKKENKATIEILTQEGTISLPINTILYCKGDGAYSTIVCENKKYTQRILLKDLYSKLNNHFVRVHRSYIVNKDKITSQKGGFVIVDKHRIPISRKR